MDDLFLRYIDDIDLALDHDCFFAALALALALPDMCGKAQFSTERCSKKRYIDWYKEHVEPYEIFEGRKAPYLSGEVVYQLRCSFLHEGNPSVDHDKIQEEMCKIDRFSLRIEKKNDYNVLMDVSSIWNSEREHPYRTYEVNVRRLCFILTACAKGYYRENTDKFHFNFEIVDLDKENIY